MKDANPRIFRSLEKIAGPGEFDTIVAAAVASYGALRSPSEAQARDFGRLVEPVWDRLLPETKRALGAALSNSPRVPREIVEKLLAEPVETAAPFLVASPVLTDMDRRLLSKSRDRRLRRIVDTAQTPPRGAAADEAGAAAGEIDRASRGTRPEAAPPTIVPAPPAAEPGKAASAVREALRRMVQPGRKARPAVAGPAVADIVAMAVQRETEAVYEALGGLLGADAPTLGAIEADETGERLAVALKALGVGSADALTVLMMLKPRIGLDVGAFDLMARYYRALKTEDCARLVGGRRRVGVPALQPQFEDVGPTARQAPRPAFGRRTARPVQADAKAKGA